MVTVTEVTRSVIARQVGIPTADYCTATSRQLQLPLVSRNHERVTSMGWNGMDANGRMFQKPGGVTWQGRYDQRSLQMRLPVRSLFTDLALGIIPEGLVCVTDSYLREKVPR